MIILWNRSIFRIIADLYEMWKSDDVIGIWDEIDNNEWDSGHIDAILQRMREHPNLYECDVEFYDFIDNLWFEMFMSEQEKELDF